MTHRVCSATDQLLLFESPLSCFSLTPPLPLCRSFGTRCIDHFDVSPGSSRQHVPLRQPTQRAWSSNVPVAIATRSDTDRGGPSSVRWLASFSVAAPFTSDSPVSGAPVGRTGCSCPSLVSSRVFVPVAIRRVRFCCAQIALGSCLPVPRRQIVWTSPKRLATRGWRRTAGSRIKRLSARFAKDS